MAAAATAARLRLNIFLRWHAAQFERQRDVLLDGMPQIVQIRLRVNEVTGHRVAEQRFAVTLKRLELRVGQRFAVLLLVTKFLTLAHEGFVLGAGLVIGGEGLDVFLGGLESRVFKDRLAKLAGLFRDVGGFGQCAHALGRSVVSRNATQHGNSKSDSQCLSTEAVARDCHEKPRQHLRQPGDGVASAEATSGGKKSADKPRPIGIMPLR